MATSINDIIARARIIATGMGDDPNLSKLIDSRPALRALLDTAISFVYRQKAADKKNWRDISVRHTITFAAGVGNIPATVLREFLHQADFQNEDADLISYLTYQIDSRAKYENYLGYVQVVGDTFEYTAPNGDAGDYSGDMYVTVPSLPEIPSDDTTNIEMTSEIFDKVCYSLALGLRAELNLI